MPFGGGVKELRPLRARPLVTCLSPCHSQDAFILSHSLIPTIVGVYCVFLYFALTMLPLFSTDYIRSRPPSQIRTVFRNAKAEKSFAYCSFFFFFSSTCMLWVCIFYPFMRRIQRQTKYTEVYAQHSRGVCSSSFVEHLETSTEPTEVLCFFLYVRRISLFGSLILSSASHPPPFLQLAFIHLLANAVERRCQLDKLCLKFFLYHRSIFSLRCL